VAFCCSYFDFAWAADKNIYTMLLQDQMMCIHFLYKIIQLLSKTGKVAVMMVKVMDFTIKMLEIILTNNIHIQGGDGGMGMLCVH
jgi:hypothetical protein